jgi:hypothetical protein
MSIDLRKIKKPKGYTDLKQPLSVDLPGGDLIYVQEGQVIFAGIPGEYVGIEEWKVEAFVDLWMERRRAEKEGK